MNQIQIKGNKVTPDEVTNSITKEKYIKVGTKKTVCHLTLIDGWEVIGVAGVVDPETYDETIGNSIAYQKALEKVWLHLGSILQDRIAKLNSMDVG